MGNNSGNGIKPKANSKLNNIMKGGVITKCDNKLCKSTNFTIPCESKVADYCLNLCERCVQLYNNDRYCDFCEQIYEDGTDDGKNWVECSLCGRWNHPECQAAQGNEKLIKGVNSKQYYCK